MSIDQTLNCCIKIEGDEGGGWGYADELLSARAYRCYREGLISDRLMLVINGVFFWQPHHCFGAWLSEFERKQLPSSYSPGTQEAPTC